MNARVNTRGNSFSDVRICLQSGNGGSLDIYETVFLRPFWLFFIDTSYDTID